jgi:hypothetical protein
MLGNIFENRSWKEGLELLPVVEDVSAADLAIAIMGTMSLKG